MNILKNILYYLAYFTIFTATILVYLFFSWIFITLLISIINSF